MEAIGKGVLHFTVGKDAGILVMNIAQEHLIYGNNPIKALKVVTDSLQGIPTELAVSVLRGYYIIEVDVEDQMFIVRERNETDTEYPLIDVKDFMEKQRKFIVGECEGLTTNFRILQKDIRLNKNRFNVDFDYDTIFKFIAGNNEVILDELYNNIEINEISNLIKATKAFILKAFDTAKTINWMYKTFKVDRDYELGNNGSPSFTEDWYDVEGDISQHLLGLSQLVQQTVSLDFDLSLVSDDVEKYIEDAIEIEEVLSKGIEPVDIMNNYSAGWLSPEGVFYGLNGEIANMLHNQIADALQEIGNIPIYESADDEKYFLKDETTKAYREKVNPDSWLEQQGWVKIHGNNVQFAGCLNNQIGKTNVNMTEVQIDTIHKYLQVCHRGIVRLGWKQEAISSARFQMMAKGNIFKLNKDYFEF